MMTTLSAIQWHDAKEHKFELDGTVLMGILMQSSKFLGFEDNLFLPSDVSKTGFVEALIKLKRMVAPDCCVNCSMAILTMIDKDH